MYVADMTLASVVDDMTLAFVVDDMTLASVVDDMTLASVVDGMTLASVVDGWSKKWTSIFLDSFWAPLEMFHMLIILIFEYRRTSNVFFKDLDLKWRTSISYLLITASGSILTEKKYIFFFQKTLALPEKFV